MDGRHLPRNIGATQYARTRQSLVGRIGQDPTNQHQIAAAIALRTNSQHGVSPSRSSVWCNAPASDQRIFKPRTTLRWRGSVGGRLSHIGRRRTPCALPCLKLTGVVCAPVRSRHGEEFLHYLFKGALRAPGPSRRRPADGAARRRHRPGRGAAGPSARADARAGIPAERRAPPTALGPDGPQRRRRANRTQPGRRDQDHTDLRPTRRTSWRGSCILPAPQCRTAQDHAQGRAEGASHAMAQGATLDRALPRITRRL